MSNRIGAFIAAVAFAQAAARPAFAACQAEFGECSTNRDCCDGLMCEGGDWSATTDFSCLSKRSMFLKNLGLEKMTDMVKEFYVENAPGIKSDDDIDELVKRRKGEFPQLVAGLERKYGVKVKHDEF
mmetsp:Transcript_11921/g.34925  ORF Transcript_11921/g.34925 Transcript_11921/m.34925 type:complete len:127 (-) Transcript_11921:433-813(-)